jgi:hypothetical protein
MEPPIDPGRDPAPQPQPQPAPSPPPFAPTPGAPAPTPPPHTPPPGDPIPPPQYAPPPGTPVPPQPYGPTPGAPVAAPAYAYAAAAPLPDQPPSIGQQIIPTKNPMALAGYYTGVFSLIPCFGLIGGPIALVLGILAFKALKQNPMLPGKGHAIAALVMGGLSTLLNWGVALFVVVAAIAARQ